jgi:O-antigen ligase
VIVLGVLAFAPWAFGSVEPWARLILFSGFAVALAIWLAQLVRRPRLNLPLPVAVVPMLAGLLLGFAQTVPWPDGALALLAPGTSRWRAQVLPSSPEVLSDAEPCATRLSEPTVSLYPAATRSMLFELSLYLAAFLLGFQYFRRRQSQLWLCGVATVVGGALALLGIIQWLTRTNRIYWVVELSQGGGPFGPFINRNNAGGFLNLCLAASLGLALYMIRPRRHRPHRSAKGAWLGERLVASVTDRFADLSAVRLGLFAVTGLIATAVLCTLSRGAFLALAGGAGVTLLAALATRRSRNVALLAGLGVAAVLLLAWAGMTDTVQKRLATLWPDTDEQPHPLLPHWEDSLTAVPDFWLLGSGLGTYRFVYRAYERHPHDAIFYHAENLYVESLLETGVVGLALVVVALGFLSVAAWRVTRTSDGERASPLAFAGIFLVASQAIHSMADFGLYIPSNALWFAVLCGSLVGRAMLTRRSAPGAETPASPRLGFSAVFLPLGAAGLLALAVLGALDVEGSIAPAQALRTWRLSRKEAAAIAKALRAPQSARKEVSAESPPTSEPTIEETVEKTIDDLTAALPGAWTDAEAHQALAELYMTRYRLETEAALREPDQTEPGVLSSEEREAELAKLLRRPGENPPAAPADAPPNAEPPVSEDVPEPGLVSDPLFLSVRLHHLPDAERDGARRSLAAKAAVQRSLLPALRHSLWARQFCPLLPRVEMHLAELSFLIQSGDSEAVYLDRARLLAPSDAGLWFGAGLLDWYADRLEAAYRSWRHSLELSGGHLGQILDRCASGLTRAQILKELLPEKPLILLAAARYLYRHEDQLAERRPLLEKALELLDAQAAPLTAEDLQVKAGVYRYLGKTDLAVQTYRASLAQQPRQVDCRYELADYLYEQGQLQQSQSQLQQSQLLLQQSLWQLQLVLDEAPWHGKARLLSQLVTHELAQGDRRHEGTRRRADGTVDFPFDSGRKRRPASGQ